MPTDFNLDNFNVALYHEILDRGLSYGPGSAKNQMCIEAAVCCALGLPFGDDPECVADSVRVYKIAMNDSDWSSPQARAAGLRNLGLAQLGSLGVVSDTEFSQRLAEKTVRILITTLFMEIFPFNKECLVAAAQCVQEGTAESAATAASCARRVFRTRTGAYLESARRAAAAAQYASYAFGVSAKDGIPPIGYVRITAHHATLALLAHSDKYLILSARLALETLRELNSPGVRLLAKEKVCQP